MDEESTRDEIENVFTGGLHLQFLAGSQIWLEFAQLRIHTQLYTSIFVDRYRYIDIGILLFMHRDILYRFS